MFYCLVSFGFSSLQTVKSHQAMADAMKGVTTALTKMNKKMNLPALNKIMQEFMKENERSELTQEMMGDAIDDAMEEPGSADEEANLVSQVFDELGINALDTAPVTPSNVATASKVEQKAEAVEEPAGTTNIFLLPIFDLKNILIDLLSSLS
jgi:charged multivesicular body protein 2A